MRGLILQATGSWYLARIDDEKVVECRLPGKFRLSEEEVTNPVAVGDIVHITMQSDGTGRIEHIEERKNRLLRKATHNRRGVQVIASNVDYVLIVQSLRQPVFKTGFIDRLLVCCEAHEIVPVIIINKTDLQISRKDASDLAEVEKLYTGLGYLFCKTSIFDEETVRSLGDLIKGKISVMTGHSGTGKTSLLNLLAPGLDLKTGDVSLFSNKGKHTTTFTRLVALSDDTYLIDTPGIREFGLVDLESYELSLYFPEMRTFRESCRFYNCTHRHEPGCSVKKAAEEEHIYPSRYRSYLHILDGIEND